MNTYTLHPVTDYVAELFSFLGMEEGFRNLPYFDEATPPRATIGYGFNIEPSDTDNLSLVLEQMGIINSGMTADERESIVDEFETAINNTPHTGDITTINNQLRANLNQVASRYGVSEFSIDEDQGYAIFTDIVADKEGRLDALLNNSLAHNSREYVAVMSLFYNRESLVNSSRRLLANAVIHDNRAEAWYEIMYNSNSDGGHTSRRYREAEMFNLYDNGGFLVDEMKEVMRMAKQSVFSNQLSA